MDDLTFEEWFELMEEPPGGFNHGRMRGDGPGWVPLETIGMDEPSFKRYVDEPHKHGTRYAYNKLKCKCARCRAWNAENQRQKRARVPTPYE